MTTTVITQVLPPHFDRLRMAAPAYLARFKGQSRVHTDSDLRAYLNWCAQHDLDPLEATRPHVELYIRWMQEQRRYAASTVSRRTSVVIGFYRTCVIDGVLAHSPADYVRRPTVSPQSPTLGLTHLQFEAMLTAARLSPNLFDFAPGLSARLAGSADLRGNQPRHRRSRRGTRPPDAARRRQGPQDRPRAHAAGRRPRGRPRRRRPHCGALLLNTHGTRMDRHAATRRLHRLQKIAGVRIARMHPHMLRHTFVTTMLDAGVDLRDTQIAARHADPRTTMRYDRARTNLDRHPNYILAAYMSSGT
jgi:integrase/recombinase XerD